MYGSEVCTSCWYRGRMAVGGSSPGSAKGEVDLAGASRSRWPFVVLAGWCGLPTRPPSTTRRESLRAAVQPPFASSVDAPL
uniref:Uncharacterized protein n=1 Tax=Arundo donax TaxID=35708 RepID=A0A0A9EEG7_ARUDO